MRILDSDKDQEVFSIALYLTEPEARQLHQRLEVLLRDPEAGTHFHTISADRPRREVSCSIVNPKKLATLQYSEVERKLLEEKK